MVVKVMRSQGSSVAVAYRDSAGMWQGGIVSAECFSAHDNIQRGKEYDIPNYCIEDAIEYGIDFGVLMPNPRTIRPEELTQAMREHGIWEVADLVGKPNEAVAAILSLVGVTYSGLVKAAHDMIGG